MTERPSHQSPVNLPVMPANWHRFSPAASGCLIGTRNQCAGAGLYEDAVAAGNPVNQSVIIITRLLLGFTPPKKDK